jgi:hypothetical protein
MAWNAVVTTNHGRTSQGKPFSWSYSKLKNYETCPARYFNIDVLKKYKDTSEALTYGNTVHDVLDKRIGQGKPLPKGYEGFEGWAQKILTGPGTILTEQQLAITKDFEPCAWFDSDNPPDKRAWYRAKVDVLKINGPVAMCIDWKTGKIIEDTPQLVLAAACVFYHHPQVQKVRTKFVWLKDDADTTVDMDRAELPEMWASLWSRIEALRLAHERTDFPPTPNSFCNRFCVVTSCPHNGRRT